MLTTEQVENAVYRNVYGTDILPYEDENGGWDEFDYRSPIDLEIDGKVYPAYTVQYFIGEDWDGRMLATIQIGDQFFTKRGTKVSHEGCFWNGTLVESKPETKTVIEYKEI